MSPRVDSQDPGASAHGGLRISEIAITARDAGLLADFYVRAIGLSVSSSDSEGVVLAMGRDRLRIIQGRGASRPDGTVGLYHFAILFPTRSALASVHDRLIQKGGTLTGAADHLVSEALYLDDPEGNGVELYRDRPREAWPMGPEGLRMATMPLDLSTLRADTIEDGGSGTGEPALGHIHLHVHEIEPAERFYREVVGLDVTQRYGASASFLSAGGYHHHVGVNTWGTLGAPPAPPGALGLRWFEVELPVTADLERVGNRASELGVAVEHRSDALWMRDPSGHRLALKVARRARAEGASGARPSGRWHDPSGHRAYGSARGHNAPW